MEDWISLPLQPCGWLCTDKPTFTERSAHQHEACSYTNAFKGTDDWHKYTYGAQGAYQGLTTMHTPVDGRHIIIITRPPPSLQCAKGGLTRPIPLRAANTFLHLLPPTRLLLIRSLRGTHTHTHRIPHWWGGWMSNSHNLPATHSCAVNLWQV